MAEHFVWMRHITIKFQFEGIHRWPDAPEEVKFLRDLHRHMFHVEAMIEVKHNDRDLEFIMVKRALEEYVQRNKNDWPETISCEQIAEGLIHYIDQLYGGDRSISVNVSEDGENGATVSVC